MNSMQEVREALAKVKAELDKPVNVEASPEWIAIENLYRAVEGLADRLEMRPRTQRAPHPYCVSGQHDFQRTGEYSGKGIGEEGRCVRCGITINLPL